MNQIMSLTGLGSGAAALVLRFLNVAGGLSVLLALTGIGLAAGVAVMTYRVAIGIALQTSRRAAIQL